MAVFLDSGNTEEIRRFHRMGLIRGVTTNPTILLKDGLTGGMGTLRKVSQEIAELINPYPLSVEVTSNSYTEMIEQAKTFSGWADNINVKITIHGPKGETENLEVIHKLETQHDIRVNVTAMMSAQQSFLAAQAGATYLSLFGGRVNNMGYNACEEIKKIRGLVDQFDLKSRIIIGSTREILNVTEWLLAGAHIVTVVPSILEGMIVHPYTKETVKMFLNDAKVGSNSA